MVERSSGALKEDDMKAVGVPNKSAMPRIVTVASCALNQTALDFSGNLKRILQSCREAKQKGAKIRTGPELEITGYGCSDHFLELGNADTFQHSWEVLKEILLSPDSRDILCDIGMPVLHRGSRYNCRVFCWNGKILLIRAKMYMADEGNYRESRWFNCWSRPGHCEPHPLPSFMHDIQREAPFGDAVLDFDDTSVAAEICEELFAPLSPHLSLALAGNVEIFLNGSASHHELGKLRRRFNLILGATSKVGGLYCYANQMGCDGDRLYFDGSAIISLNGQLLAQSPQFSLKACEVVCATADLDLIQILRGNRPSFTNQSAASHQLFPTYARIKCEGIKLCSSNARTATTAAREPVFLAEEEEIGLGPALWMWDYLRKCGGRGFFLPLSGGLDSGSCALIVYCLAEFLAAQAAEDGEIKAEIERVLGFKDDDDLAPAMITNRLLYTCYFGTSNSTADSRSRAEKLASCINSQHQTFFIDLVIGAAVSLFSTILGKSFTPRFKAHGGSVSESLALQNLQARLRLCLSYYYVQLVTAMQGNASPLLVIATGNCDEGLSGYFTKYDCSSGDLNPIGSICKNDLKKFVRFMMNKYPSMTEALHSIVEAIPAAELEPSIEGVEPQTDEADMGITYEELDTFGKLRSVNRCGPYSMFTRLCAAFPATAPAQHYARVAFFFRKYAANRHKMTVLPPAYHAMATSPDDHRFDLRPFLYGQWSWEWQFKRIERDLQE